MKNNIFENNNQRSSTVATRTWVLSTEWTRYWYPNEKLLVFAVYLNGRCCYQVAWVLYGVNKDKGDESLTLLAFRRNVINVIFLEYSKEGRFSSSHLRIRNIPLDVCCDDTKYY